jgi:hypothetical protein
MIFLIALNTKPVEFRVKTADALEDAQVARLAERFANHFRLHRHKLLHYRAKVKPNFAPLIACRSCAASKKEALLLFSVAKWHAAC